MFIHRVGEDMATDPAVTLSDQHLVEACLAGDSQGWEMLLQRYKRLIYSVPVLFGFDHDDRHEIFQIVCLEILKNMPSMRDAGKLRSWILTITIRESNDFLRRKCAEREKIGAFLENPRLERAVDTLSIYLAAEKEAILREAMAEMPLRCRRLIELLFFSEPLSIMRRRAPPSIYRRRASDVSACAVWTSSDGYWNPRTSTPFNQIL